MTEPYISISQLFKVFGANPAKAQELVLNGVDKNTLKKEYNHILGLNNINLEIPKGKIQVIMGLSGSGKSTLIRHINRLIEPTSGAISVDGNRVLDFDQDQLRHFRRTMMSMVFQKFALLPHKTVLQNVAYGLDLIGIDKTEANRRSRKWIDRVGLSGFENNYPSQLSGGMQQRVGLARALATDAPILLMDEAFSALDPLIRSDMQGVLLDLQAELHKTIIFITHDLEEALRIGENIAILRDGEIIQNGAPQEIVLNPVNDYVSDFTQEINRGRVLKVQSLTKKLVAETDLRLEADDLLEDALKHFSVSNCLFAKVYKDDAELGVVSLRDIISAIPRKDASIQKYN
jgi:glycine betaine/proline transport system ATP-binding protein